MDDKTFEQIRDLRHDVTSYRKQVAVYLDMYNTAFEMAMRLGSELDEANAEISRLRALLADEHELAKAA